MAVLKIVTDIITGIAIGWPVIQVIMYVETFKLAVIVFIGNVIICLMSYWPIIFSLSEGVHWYWKYHLEIDILEKMAKLPINIKPDLPGYN